MTLLQQLEQFINNKREIINIINSTAPYICCYCILRCINCINYELYCFEYNIIYKHIYNHETTNINSNQYECNLCVGILQHLTLHTNTIKQYIAQSGYITDSYKLLTSISSTLLFRQQHYLHKYLAPHDTTYIIDLKECIKHMYAHSLDISIGDTCTLQLTIKFIYNNTSNEVLLMENATGISINQSLQIRHRHNKRQKMNQRIKYKLYNNHHSTQPMSNIDTDISTATYLKYMSAISNQQYAALQYEPIVHNTDTTTIECCAILYRTPIYISGQYNKYARNVSQSPWIIHNNLKRNEHDGIQTSSNTTEMSELNVESQITKHMKSVYNPSKMMFSSSGREDMDVRMLGNGRLFYIELFDCKQIYDANHTIYNTIQCHINNDNPVVQVNNIHLSNRTLYDQMNKSIDKKNKYYRCIIITNKSITVQQLQQLIDCTTSFTIAQHTPIRVSHRRADLCRIKTIYCMSTQYINSTSFQLDLCTSSGTYIKEYVHSDNGRTQPNIGSMLGDGYSAEIIQLDVMQLFDHIPTINDMNIQNHSNNTSPTMTT